MGVTTAKNSFNYVAPCIAVSCNIVSLTRRQFPRHDIAPVNDVACTILYILAARILLQQEYLHCLNDDLFNSIIKTKFIYFLYF